MGNRHKSRADFTAAWSDKYGCKHYTDETTVMKLKWKTVPITKEEAKMVLRRMMTIAEKVAVPGTTGLKKDKKTRSHDVIEVRF